LVGKGIRADPSDLSEERAVTRGGEVEVSQFGEGRGFLLEERREIRQDQRATMQPSGEAQESLDSSDQGGSLGRGAGVGTASGGARGG
jgi:hypothetical protein